MGTGSRQRFADEIHNAARRNLTRQADNVESNLRALGSSFILVSAYSIESLCYKLEGRGFNSR
jgi:hypothetical protein